MSVLEESVICMSCTHGWGCAHISLVVVGVISHRPGVCVALGAIYNCMRSELHSLAR